LTELRSEALEPDKIDRLIHIVRDDLGYSLYRAVENAKLELSANPAGRLLFRDDPVSLDETIRRPRFEDWIDRDIKAIDSCVDRLLNKCHVAPDCVDAVFMTGGSSFVPAIRKLFAQKFGGEAKLRSGDELTSVAQGLAIRALE
jgi:hypothetical chaperone protein